MGTIVTGRHRLFFVLMAALMVSGCASSGALTPAERPASEREVERSIRQEVRKWDGTPHRLGGASRSGMDCSAFVGILYRDLFEVQLPRATEDQVREGRRVERKRLMAGDLVFFRPSAKTRHVGIYLGESEFAHVSTSSGVMISSLNERYWNNRYWTARRILPAPLLPVAGRTERHEPAADRRQPRSAQGANRTGW